MQFTRLSIFIGLVGFSSVLIAEEPKSQNGEQITEYRLESAIVGDKEQPAVSYFIPWKGTSTPDKLQWNLDVKYDQTLDLVDRDVMLRSMHIYDEMKLESPGATE